MAFGPSYPPSPVEEQHDVVTRLLLSCIGCLLICAFFKVPKEATAYCLLFVTGANFGALIADLIKGDGR